jgi:trimethylamine--corrinoid protein Co-methyltransferase
MSGATGLAGQIRVLSSDQMQTVHEKACELLSKKGMIFESDAVVDIFKRNGCKVEGNTVFIGKKLVESCVAQTPATFRLEAIDPANSVTVGEGILIHPSGGEIFVRDFDGTRRSPTLSDFAQMQTVYQACPNVDIAGYQPISPMDVPGRSRGLRCVFESFRHSTKPILSPMELETVEAKLEVLKLYDIAFGGGQGGGRSGGGARSGTSGGASYLDDHYVTWHIVCPNSPYFYSQFACDGIKVYAENNQPVVIVSAPMTGITSPVFLLSTVILALAEELAGLVLAQLIKPGVPVVLSASLTYGYMRTATWECASPDTSLMLAASVQMCREFYNLPARAQTGVTSAKRIDYQAGMETMQSFLFTALAGVNLTSQTVSSLANLLVSSLEKTVLDDELISRVRHLTGGLAGGEEQMAMDVLMQAEPCSDFLGADSTVEHFREYWTPTVSDWRNIDEWEADGSPDVLENAHKKVTEILEQAPQSLLDSDTEKDMLDYIEQIETQ